MKIKIHGHEITQPKITRVSLVKRGANRSPFKIVKADDDEVAASSESPARGYVVLRGGFGHSLDDLEADVRARRHTAEKY